MIELDTSIPDGARIRVIGVGGGGGNAINNMIKKGLTGVDFIATNTDKQALSHNLAPIKLQLDNTRGLGAGAKPEVGRKSTEDKYDELKEILKGSDMIFITAGMGGGTGTGGSPIIAKIGQEIDALVVAIVTKPFDWEGKKRAAVAEEGIKELRQYVDALIVIPNQKLLSIIEKKTTFGEAFEKVDEVLYNATRGIADIIAKHGRVNLDFADVRTIMKGMGDALMGIGTASGENRAAEATHNALNSPLLDGISVRGAQGVLVNITGGSDVSMHEIAEAVSIVEEATGSDVNLIHGVVYNDEPSEEIMVTVVATGFNKNTKNNVKQEAETSTPNNDSFPFSFISRGGVNVPSSFIRKNLKEDKEVVNTFQNNSFNESPRGIDLKKFDSPAFERRKQNDGNGINIPSFTRFPSYSNEVVEETERDEHNQLVIESMDKPAFLRKIMD